MMNIFVPFGILEMLFPDYMELSTQTYHHVGKIATAHIFYTVYHGTPSSSPVTNLNGALTNIIHIIKSSVILEQLCLYCIILELFWLIYNVAMLGYPTIISPAPQQLQKFPQLSVEYYTYLFSSFYFKAVLSIYLLFSLVHTHIPSLLWSYYITIIIVVLSTILNVLMCHLNILIFVLALCALFLVKMKQFISSVNLLVCNITSTLYIILYQQEPYCQLYLEGIKDHVGQCSSSAAFCYSILEI